MGAVGVIVLLASVGSAPAATSHKIDEVLSLTGGCTVPDPKLDSLSDPGCPDPPHPPQSFTYPTAVTTDFKGNIYVASFGKVGSNGSEGRVDIFNSKGFFITELSVPRGPQSLAVDSNGVLYVVSQAKPRLVRYMPSVYGPGPADIAYGNAPETLLESSASTFVALALNKDNDHLFAHLGVSFAEWESPPEGGERLPDISPGVFSSHGAALAIDSQRRRIYAVSNGSEPSRPRVIKVFNLDSPHELLLTIDGSTVPGEKFFDNEFTIAVDEETGHLFVYDGAQKRVDELTESGGFVGLIEYEVTTLAAMQIAVDNGPESPNGGLSEGRYLFVPSHPTGTGHSFAFGPSEECEPEVKSPFVANATTNEAELRATVNPCNVETAYTFEFTTQENFESEGFAGAVVAGGGTLPATNADISVLAGATGLTPGTDYRFRVFATNALGEDEAEGAFSTYPTEGIGPCPNDYLRTGLSALLPDCRAYELVTPADTNARAPFGLSDAGSPSPNSSPSGDKVSFRIEGGALPGTEATGSLEGDPYLSSRETTGWSTAYVGPSGAESVASRPGSTSPDQGYEFWNTGSQGSAVVGGEATSYVRYPDGHSELVGRGSTGTDPRATGVLISEGGDHIIFRTGVVGSPKQLEPEAPPTGTQAVYDRTADGITHVISLLPGEVTPTPGQNATYQGASLDGKGVAFSIGAKLYLRFDNSETFEIATGVTFAGVAEGGNRIFYVDGGKLMRFDALTDQTTAFNESGTAIPVNVSADGSAAYLVSTTVLTTEPNPMGEEAANGQQNLYLSRGPGQISFIGTVTERDVKGENNGAEQVDGLGLWVRVVGPIEGPPGRYGVDPSRTTADGDTIVFESRANLTGYDPEGHAQVYRYDSGAGELQCLSCIPTGAVATGEASLLSISNERGKPIPLSIFAFVKNLSADGRRAFFQTTEALVPRDTDGLQDIYEWEDQGVGSCTSPGGCVYLISSGGSDSPEYLYSVSDSGDDVFIWSGELLLPSDTDETPSIYDARVGGGFPSDSVSCGIGQPCSDALTPPPILPSPGSRNTGPSGNVPKTCPKGKRKVKRAGKVRCVKKKRGKHHKRKDGSGKGGRRR